MVKLTPLGLITIGPFARKHGISEQQARRGYDSLFGLDAPRLGGKRVLGPEDEAKLEAALRQRGWIKPASVSA